MVRGRGGLLFNEKIDAFFFVLFLTPHKKRTFIYKKNKLYIFVAILHICSVKDFTFLKYKTNVNISHVLVHPARDEKENTK